MELHGQRFLVMGASTGPGASIVEAMVACGGDVIAASRRRTALYDLRAALRHHERLHTAECDATDGRGVDALLASIETKAPLDGVVHATRAGADHVARSAAARMHARGRGCLILVGESDALGAVAEDVKREIGESPVRVHWLRTEGPEDCAGVGPKVVHLVADGDMGWDTRSEMKGRDV